MPHFFLILGLLFCFNSCSKNKIEKSLDSLEGQWVLQNRFYGDVVVPPCDQQQANVIEVTIDIQKDKNNTWLFSGKSVINSYFGKFEIQLLDENTKRFSIDISSMGSTQIGGSRELMECETEYFRLLRAAKEIDLTENNLNWGIFPPKDAPISRDGGTFLIFKKIK